MQHSLLSAGCPPFRATRRDGCTTRFLWCVPGATGVSLNGTPVASGGYMDLVDTYSATLTGTECGDAFSYDASVTPCGGQGVRVGMTTANSSEAGPSGNCSYIGRVRFSYSATLTATGSSVGPGTQVFDLDYDKNCQVIDVPFTFDLGTWNIVYAVSGTWSNPDAVAGYPANGTPYTWTCDREFSIIFRYPRTDGQASPIGQIEVTLQNETTNETGTFIDPGALDPLCVEPRFCWEGTALTTLGQMGVRDPSNYLPGWAAGSEVIAC